VQSGVTIRRNVIPLQPLINKDLEKSMDIVLYYAPNTCALAPYVTLTEAGATLDYEKSVQAGFAKAA
jgi:hypothetical protein